MAMTYSSLIAGKGASGSIANWANYSKLDLPTIVDEAQALIYASLRVREMLTDVRFTMALNYAHQALPARFLDPVGRIFLSSFNLPLSHKDSSYIQQARTYTETAGTLGTDPFTTVSGSTLVAVALTGNGFTQDSNFYTTGATAVGGMTIAGTFPIVALTDANNFVIDIASLGTATSSASGGGSAVAYTCDQLTYGVPNWWGIWNETIYFDQAFAQPSLALLQYFQSLPLLSTSNETNFLTNRYPQLMRRACMTAAADFMKDSTEYNKQLTALGGLIQQINVENDGFMRGMDLSPEIP